MPRPIVIAHHLVWTAYGFWLPNDPRGSHSQKVASDLVAELGQLHRGRRKVQPSSHTIREFQQRAKEILKYRVARFDLNEPQAIAEAFAETVDEHKYTCYACVIMPDHIHALIRKHKHTAEAMIENLQETSRLRLRTGGTRSADHPIWGGPGWKVFLDHPDEIRRIIKYIQDNPLKWKLPRQRWPFVKPYDGWPLHPGHNPKSPYARRLREY